MCVHFQQRWDWLQETTTVSKVPNKLTFYIKQKKHSWNCVVSFHTNSNQKCFKEVVDGWTWMCIFSCHFSPTYALVEIWKAPSPPHTHHVHFDEMGEVAMVIVYESPDARALIFQWAMRNEKILKINEEDGMDVWEPFYEGLFCFFPRCLLSAPPAMRWRLCLERRERSRLWTQTW